MYRHSIIRNRVFLYPLLLLTMVNGSSLLAAPNLRQQANRNHTNFAVMPEIHALKEPVQIPDVPTFTGHTKFVGGNTMRVPNSITSYQMRFYADKDPKAVVSFYKTAFTNKGWKIANANSNSVTAEDRYGHQCVITARDSNVSDDIKSMFTIAYQQMNMQPRSR
jgi:hypothetical protein